MIARLRRWLRRSFELITCLSRCEHAWVPTLSELSERARCEIEAAGSITTTGGRIGLDNGGHYLQTCIICGQEREIIRGPNRWALLYVD